MCLETTTAVGRHVVGKNRVHQQRHMAEQVVEQIRLGNVIELIGTANPPCHREAAVGQVLEEGEFGQQTLDADQLPASGISEHLIDLVKTRNLQIGRASCRERGGQYV